ncbi:MAG: sialidase family protein [Acidobacteriota bacterium]
MTITGFSFPSALSAPHSEFVFESAPFASCHAATLVETEDRGLLAAWFGGSVEGAPDVAIWMSRKTHKGWTPPEVVAREDGVATFNPVLFRSANRVLWLSYKFGPSPTSWTGALKSSADEGKTWSASFQLPAGLYGPIKNKPVLLPDGTLVAGTSVESHKAWACWVERTVDPGRSWTRHGPIVVPRVAKGIIQPAIVHLGGGRLRMFVRSTAAIGRVCYADSSDGGLTWTDAAPLSLPNPNSGIDAVKLRDGRLVLVYNHATTGRSPLNLAVSRDDGTTWERFADLETEPGEYSYPAIIQSSDDAVHVVYTWQRKRIKHVTLTPQDIP